MLASDMMISTVDMSADVAALKMYPIGRHWVAQFSGSDTSQITPILNSLRSKIALVQETGETLPFVSQLFSKAWEHRLTQKIETEVLRTLGYSIAEFREKGLSELGAEAFSRKLYEIEQQSLDLQILVSGFDGAEPHIFSVRDPGKFTYYSQLGFWAIGSGETHALGSFFNSRDPLRTLDRASTLYRVCEAKFNAENAIGVGETTCVMVMYQDGSRLNPTNEEIKSLKEAWQRTRVRTVPEEAKAIASEILARADKNKIRSQGITKTQKRFQQRTVQKSEP